MKITALIAAASAALALAASSSPAAAMTPLDPLPDAGHASFVTEGSMNADIGLTTASAQLGSDVTLNGPGDDALTDHDLLDNDRGGASTIDDFGHVHLGT